MAPRCTACATPVLTSERAPTYGWAHGCWHRQCFACASCGAPPWHFVNSKLLCNAHYAQHRAQEAKADEAQAGECMAEGNFLLQAIMENFGCAASRREGPCTKRYTTASELAIKMDGSRTDTDSSSAVTTASSRVADDDDERNSFTTMDSDAGSALALAGSLGKQLAPSLQRSLSDALGSRRSSSGAPEAPGSPARSSAASSERSPSSACSDAALSSLHSSCLDLHEHASPLELHNAINPSDSVSCVGSRADGREDNEGDDDGGDDKGGAGAGGDEVRARGGAGSAGDGHGGDEVKGEARTSVVLEELRAHRARLDDIEARLLHGTDHGTPPPPSPPPPLPSVRRAEAAPAALAQLMHENTALRAALAASRRECEERVQEAERRAAAKAEAAVEARLLRSLLARAAKHDGGDVREAARAKALRGVGESLR